MHVLLTNDDGPLDDASCPYIKYLVDEIKSTTDWDLSIVVPNQQRSWIGKAHFAGKTLSTSYIYTKESTAVKNDKINAYEGPFNARQPQFADYQEWCLIDSTPAACADIGIHHLYSKSKSKPIDLVLSGPNFGKNSGNLYILTSGTIGAAMEAVTHGVKAIALSYAFNDLEHDYDILKEAAKISVKLVKRLYADLQKQEDVDIYSINVPLIPSLKLGSTKIHYAPILKNFWESIYAPTDERNEHGQEQFVWKPDFKKVYKDGLADFEHTDSRVLLNEGISVTPLKASFHFVEPFQGEIVLSENEESTVSISKKVSSLNINTSKITTKFDGSKGKYLLITIPDSEYIFEPIINGFSKINYNVTTDRDILKHLSPDVQVFHYCDYEDIDLDLIGNPNYFIPSYIYRKALIRKHYLANTIHHYTTKNPQSILKSSVPESYQLEVDYAEFLDDALDDAYELKEEIESGEKTWILKPSMSDKGQGIRIFNTVDQLQEIFNSFEEGYDSYEEAEDDNNNGVIISQLRHFIVQQYQSNPLLLSNYDNRKFHLRTYIVCQGNLTVYVYKSILTLFSGSSYVQPNVTDGEIDMAGHLTNTCLQGETALVVPFWDLQDEKITNDIKTDIFEKVCNVTTELYKAATTVDKMNFQPFDHAVEIFGVDFLVNDDYSVTLLEVNSYPDFKQTGDDLKQLIDELFEEVAHNVVAPLMDGTATTQDSKSKLIPVLKQDESP